LLSVSLFGCLESKVSTNTVKVNVSVTDDTNTIIFSGSKDLNKGLNAFDAMKQIMGDNNISYKSYDFGIFVDGLAGKTAPKTHYWALYVNQKSADAGIASYSLDYDYNFDWKLEKIEDYS
jgi:hypothetical protein